MSLIMSLLGNIGQVQYSFWFTFLPLFFVLWLIKNNIFD